MVGKRAMDGGTTFFWLMGQKPNIFPAFLAEQTRCAVFSKWPIETPAEHWFNECKLWAHVQIHECLSFETKQIAKDDHNYENNTTSNSIYSIVLDDQYNKKPAYKTANTGTHINQCHFSPASAAAETKLNRVKPIKGETYSRTQNHNFTKFTQTRVRVRKNKRKPKSSEPNSMERKKN